MADELPEHVKRAALDATAGLSPGAVQSGDVPAPDGFSKNSYSRDALVVERADQVIDSYDSQAIATQKAREATSPAAQAEREHSQEHDR